jgi:hypothetical protein
MRCMDGNVRNRTAAAAVKPVNEGEFGQWVGR